MPVLGMGGYFFRAKGSAGAEGMVPRASRCGRWPGATDPATGRPTSGRGTPEADPWCSSPFKADSEYFAADRTAMINLRVSDLDGMLAGLRAAGIEVTRRGRDGGCRAVRARPRSGRQPDRIVGAGPGSVGRLRRRDAVCTDLRKHRRRDRHRRDHGGPCFRGCPTTSRSMWFGYLVMLTALSLVFVGVRRFRDIECGGVIGASARPSRSASASRSQALFTSRGGKRTWRRPGATSALNDYAASVLADGGASQVPPVPSWRRLKPTWPGRSRPIAIPCNAR